MPENRSNAASISSNGPLDHIEEGMCRMKIEKKEGGGEGGEEVGGGYPNRPGVPDCIYFLRTGHCGYGSSCRYNHPLHPPNKSIQLPWNTNGNTDLNKLELPQREGQPDCGYYLKTGSCKYGSTCKYHHPLDRRGAGQVTLNSVGLPIREEKPCPYYLRTFTCKFGAACKFDHPQPAVEAALPVSGAATMGMGSALPSAGIPYVGAVPAWSMSRSPYIASSRVPTPQTYMPVVFPPLQGPVTAQSWNGYMQGSMSSIAASSMMGTDHVYNSKNPGEMVDFLTLAVSNLPERPDQPECRYFMSTGNCKYGSNCKFHHPNERIAHSLGPHGLPLRPGEETCGHFSSYGICKYGPTCKFNHPIAGYISSYYFGMPSIPVMNQPFFPSQRNLPISNSTETSQSKSSKITDWIQKPDTVGGKNRPHAVTKTVEEPQEQVDDQSNAASAPTACDIPQEQAD